MKRNPAFLLCTLILAACNMGVRPPTSTLLTIRPPSEEPTLPTADILLPLGMEFAWEPSTLGDRDDVKKMYLLKSALLVLSDTGFLYGIDLNTGWVRWRHHVKGGMTFAPTLYQYKIPKGDRRNKSDFEEIYILTHDRLIVLDGSGNELWNMELPFMPSTPAIGNKTHIFIGGWDRRIYAINKKTRVRDWSYLTDNHVSAPLTISTVTKGPAITEILYAASEDGNVYAFDPLNGNNPFLDNNNPRRFQPSKFSTPDKLMHAPTFFQERIYVGGEDTYAYSILLSQFEGPPEWSFPTGGPITSKPVAILDTIFFTSRVGTIDSRRISTKPILYAVDRRDEQADPTSTEFTMKAGRIRWKIDGGEQILARGRNHVYILNSHRNLQAVDIKTGKYLWEEAITFTSGARTILTNPWHSLDPTVQDKDQKKAAGNIYMGYRGGKIIAIRERPEF